MARLGTESALALLLAVTLATATSARATDGASRTARPQPPNAGSEEPARAGMARAMALLAAEKPDEAATALEELLRVHPEFGPAHLQLGRILLEAGDAESARAHFQKAVRTTTPRPFLAWHLLGVSRLRTGAAQQALAAFDEALTRAPRFGPALLARAQARLQLGQVELAEADFLRATRLDSPPPAGQLLFQVREAQQRGDYWQALDGYRQLLEDFPSLPSLQAGAAWVALAMGAFEPAGCLASAALEGSPLDGSLHYLLCAAETAAGSPDAADACNRALELGHREAAVYEVLGDAELGRTHLAEAVAAYRRALELDPDTLDRVPDVVLAVWVGESADFLRPLLAARLSVDPNHLRSLNALGEIAVRADDTATARKYFERLADLTPADAQVHYNLGQVYLRLGQVESGRAAMGRFRSLRLEMDAEWLRQNDAHRQRLEARRAFAAGTPHEALRIYRELAATGTASQDDYLAAGDGLLAVGDYPGAGSWFSRVLEASPYEAGALHGQALAATANGDSDRARLYRDRLELLSWPCGASAEPGNSK